MVPSTKETESVWQKNPKQLVKNYDLVVAFSRDTTYYIKNIQEQCQVKGYIILTHYYMKTKQNNNLQEDE